MVDNICNRLTKKMRKEMPDMDDEKEEIINYGLHLIIGEIPKIFITLLIAYILGVFNSTIIMILLLLPYRATSGGFHLKTHIGCIISTTLYYCGIAKISEYFFLYNPLKVIFILCVWIFGIIIIKLYAPADTENVPIIQEKERMQKRILSYIFLTVGLIIALFINNHIISNIIILGNLCQTIMITPIAYKITKNEYGYKMYSQDVTSNTLI